jgi:hypothetical protein
MTTDDLVSKVLTDLELAGIKIYPPDRWQEVKQAFTEAIDAAIVKAEGKE